ncbi:MAG: hypothetical protein ABFR65_05335 [Pseudomonadota bacterium]
MNLVLRQGCIDGASAPWYQHKVKRDGGLKSKAIVALIRKPALSLWHVARGEAFDSGKRFNTHALGITG